MAKYKAIITQRDGTRICLDLSCREYHAQKLNYIFSRTLDRGVYSDAAVVACGNCGALIELAEMRLEPKEKKGGDDE